MSKIIQVMTKFCPECGDHAWLYVEEDKFLAWERGDLLVTQAFPELTDDEREMLLTGLHGVCWDAYMGPEPDDEDEYVDGWDDTYDDYDSYDPYDIDRDMYDAY